MEDVLETYQKPRDPDRPLVCLDETSKQLVVETRKPIPAKWIAAFPTSQPSKERSPLGRPIETGITPKPIGSSRPTAPESNSRGSTPNFEGAVTSMSIRSIVLD